MMKIILTMYKGPDQIGECAGITSPLLLSMKADLGNFEHIKERKSEPWFPARPRF